MADLICKPQEDNFKLNLFPEQFAFSQPKEAKESSGADDDTMISIDLKGQGKDARVTKLIDEFADISLKKESQMTGNDLLDMMDDL